MNGSDYLREKLTAVLRRKGFAEPGEVIVSLERPKAVEHGDLSTNVAMLLASRLKRNPRDIAADIVAGLDLDTEIVSTAEIAGAGFINFRFGNGYYHKALREILQAGPAYGNATWGQSRRVQFEFVSANPTGPLNIVSARAAAVGDVLANLFAAVGFEVEREYYVNDAGRQIKLLGKSVSARYMQLFGAAEEIPENGYRGDYIADLAKQLAETEGDRFASMAQDERWQTLSQLALKTLLASQRAALEAYRVSFDTWFSEKELRESNGHMEVLATLAEKGFVYEQDGAKWFSSSQFGDEKDRVLITKEGEPTYFLVDIAYHVDKYDRDFVKLYDLWGPDHHGYIARMKAALVALGYPEDSFEVLIVQQVNLLENGESVKMSKRAGRIIEMQELLEEVGVDVARFFFIARRTQSPLDFDLDLAKKTSDENPVYYVQYAHARTCNIIRHAREKGVDMQEQAPLSRLREEEEMMLIKKFLEFPQTVSKAAEYLEPHRIPTYLQELAAIFHRFYHKRHVVTDDIELTQARLHLVKATRIVLARALALLGVSAPEQM